MKFKKILLTGAAGFIGSHVYDLFSEKYCEAEITILDKMTYAANIRNIPQITTNKKHKLIVGDLTDMDICLKATKDIDLVINLAAESHVDNSFDNSIIFSKSNTLGTHTLMEACKRNKVDKIIHVSTDEVYGENVEEPFSEEDPLNPTNPYSASKAAAEMIVRGYFKSFDLPVIVVRSNNIYGIRQYPEKIIPKFIVNCIKKEPIKIHGDGLNLRHYLSAVDFANALDLLSNNGKEGEIYNIASDLELTNIAVSKLIKSFFDYEIDVIHVDNRPFNDKRYYLNDKKLRDLGWGPNFNLRDDLPNIINWYNQNHFLFY